MGLAEVTDITESALDLRDAYLQARIVTPKYSDDGCIWRWPPSQAVRCEVPAE